jgi:hypothetical protein
MIEKVKKFNWWRIVFPFTTYFKLKYGFRNPVLMLLDLLILLIPFSSIFVMLLVKYVLNDVEE